MLGKNVSPRIQKLENDFIRNGGCFKEYKIEDLFRNLKVSLKLSKLDISEEFTFPVYSSDTSNGGIYGYSNFAEFIVDDENESYLIFGDHTRTFNIARQSFAVMDNVKVLKPLLKYWSDESLLYVATIWKKQIPNYGYSRHWKYAKSCLLKLPSYNDELAFDYMESYIRELEQERIRELDAYLRATGLNDYELTPEEEKCIKFMQSGGVKYKEFKIGELFDIRKGKRLTKADQTSGFTPFIGSTDSNNGLTGYIGQSPIFNSPAITVNYNGSVGKSFYQEYDFWASDDVNVLYLKNHILSDLLYGYFGTVFEKSSKKYSYAFKWNLERMKESLIVIPVDLNGNIDYDFMTSFIKAIQKQCIRPVVEWKERVIETTKFLVGENA